MQSAFESWIGRSIVLRLRVQQVKVTVHGLLLNDQNDELVVRLDAGPDIRVLKKTVLAIEDLGLAPLSGAVCPQRGCGFLTISAARGMEL